MAKPQYTTSLYRAALGLAALVSAMALLWYALAALETDLVDFIPPMPAGERLARIVNEATISGLAHLAVMLLGVLLWVWMNRIRSRGWRTAMAVGFCLTAGAAFAYFSAEIYLMDRSHKIERILLDGIPIGIATAAMTGIVSACMSLIAWRIAYVRVR